VGIEIDVVGVASGVWSARGIDRLAVIGVGVKDRLDRGVIVEQGAQPDDHGPGDGSVGGTREVQLDV
jgi:hypothetical protein